MGWIKRWNQSIFITFERLTRLDAHEHEHGRGDIF